MLSAYARQNVEKHIPLARSIAWKMARKNSMLDVQDLIEEAMVSLTVAADRFDESRGVPFPGYASVVISHSLLDYCEMQAKKLRCYELWEEYDAVAVDEDSLYIGAGVREFMEKLPEVSLLLVKLRLRGYTQKQCAVYLTKKYNKKYAQSDVSVMLKKLERECNKFA